MDPSSSFEKKQVLGKHGDTGDSELHVVRAVAEREADVGALSMQTMERNRLRRLQACGLSPATARHLSDLHTPNLM